MHLHFNWKNYRSLFGTSPERIDLLNWAAPSLFGFLDGILRNDVLLAIARLTDPPKSAGRDNASLAHLIDFVAAAAGTSPVDTWRAKLHDLQTYCDPIRELRNRLLAHNDLATAVQFRADPVPGISRAYVEGALERLRDLFGDMERRFFGSATSHELVIADDDGESLIFALESAREHERCRERDFVQKSGAPST